jgi:hypothetical protein
MSTLQDMADKLADDVLAAESELRTTGSSKGLGQSCWRPRPPFQEAP